MKTETSKINNKDFFEALEQLVKERHVSMDYMLEKIEAALISAYKKEYNNNTNVRVEIDRDKKEIKIFQQKEVVEVVENPETQISLIDAKALSKRNKLGGIVEIALKTQNFRRLSAGAAKSVVIQGIREGERKAQQEIYEGKHGEIITVTVFKADPDSGNVLIDTDYGRGILKHNDLIPGEEFRPGDKIRVCVTDINRDERGPAVVFSRVSGLFLKKILETEIPEIAGGFVTVHGVSREAGMRSKVAVSSSDPNVDPIGSCIGQSGERIRAIMNELNGEHIDIIPFDEDIPHYIANSLAPAEVISVEITGERNAMVIVPADQLSLAIGKEGQNARLAARLTGYKIDIHTDEER